MIIPLLIADVIVAAIVFFLYNRLPPQLPLFYSRPWGEAQLGDLWMLGIIVVLAHGFYFVNIFISKRFFKGEKFIASLLRIVNLSIITVSSLIVIKIVLLVTV